MRTVCLFLLAGVGLPLTLAAAESNPALSPAQQEGRRVFQQKCAVCHVPASALVRPYAPPLSKNSLQDEDQARTVIRQGRSDRMPGFQYTLRPAQIEDVVAYLTTLEEPPRAVAQPAPPPEPASGGSVLLAGSVRSVSGEPMEGVTVSAKMEGRPITISVFTDAQGEYYFPPLEEGSYSVWAQAAGYREARRQTKLKGSVQRREFSLESASDFFLQLSGDEMVAALPEDTPAHRRMKDVFLRNCTGCHEGDIPLQNRFDEQGWEAFIEAMSRIEAYGTFPAGRPPAATIAYFKKDLAAYLAEMRGPGPSPMRLTLPPHPAGEATLPVVYEYDLPEEEGGGYILNNGSHWSEGPSVAAGGGLGLHDAQVDWDGNIWFTYNQRGSRDRTVGKVDARTGAVTNCKYPAQNGLAALTHGITVAHDGVLWFNINTGASSDPNDVPGKLGRLDPRAGKIEVFSPAPGMASVQRHVEEDGLGYIWAATDRGALRFDPRTQQFREFQSLTLPGRSYGVAGDRQGNGWWTQIDNDIIGHSDIETGRSLQIKEPPAHSSLFLRPGDLSPEDLRAYGPLGTGAQTPRRPSADKSSDDVWIPDYAGNNLLRVNSRTLKTTYYPAPRLGLNPYMPGIDSHHNVWMNLQGSDEVAKFDPRTAEWTLYSWPSRGTGLRSFHLLDRGGQLKLAGAYFNGNRVAVMVMRSRRDIAALRSQVHALARR